jgi:tetrahydromethanopterin S-methyltransferase subunit G
MGIEDKISIEDLHDKSDRKLIEMIFMQVYETNSKVADHEKRISKIEDCIDDKAEKEDVKVLKSEVHDKIGYRLFKNLSIVLGVLISILIILTTIIGLLPKL